MYALSCHRQMRYTVRNLLPSINRKDGSCMVRTSHKLTQGLSFHDQLYVYSKDSFVICRNARFRPREYIFSEEDVVLLVALRLPALVPHLIETDESILSSYVVPEWPTIGRWDNIPQKFRNSSWDYRSYGERCRYSPATNQI